MRTRLRHTKTRAYSLILRRDPFAYAYAFGAEFIAAELASSGEVVKLINKAPVAIYAELPGNLNSHIIRDSLNVSDGSIVWRDGLVMRCWDPSSGQIHERSITAKHTASPPVSVGNRVFWFEMPTEEYFTTTQWRLIETNPVFGLSSERVFDVEPVSWVPTWIPKAIVISGNAVICNAYWASDSDFETGAATARIPFSGSVEVEPEHDFIGREDEHDRTIMLPYLDKSYGVLISTDGERGSTILRANDDVYAVPSLHWPSPSSGASVWRYDNTQNGDAYNGFGLVHGERDGASKVLVSSIDPPHDEPLYNFEPSKIDGVKPELIYIGKGVQ